MAWSATGVASLASGTDATSGATGSYTPTANRLMLAYVENSKVGTPDVPTFTGNGLTWSQVVTDVTGATNTRQSLFAALSGGSPSAGADTADFAGATQISISILVVEVDGANISGTALAAVLQNTANGSSTGATSGSATLGSAPTATSRCFYFSMHQAAEATTPRASWTEIQDVNHAAPNRGVESQWRSDAAEQTGSATWTTSSGWQGIVAEVAATAVASTWLDRSMPRGMNRGMRTLS